MSTETNIRIEWRDQSRPTSRQGEYGPMRATRYGEPIVAPAHGGKLYPVADEGSYFVATNPTPGTGIAGIAAADGFDDLETLLLIRNTSKTKRLYLDYLLLMPTAAGTGGTNFNVAMKLDTGATRRSSGGTAITPKNVNQDSTETAECDVHFGAVVTAAATADARLIADYALRSVIKVIGDKYLFTFGDTNRGNMAGVALEGTAQLALHVPCPPVVLAETDQFLLHEWAASQTVGASYRFQLGFWLR